VSVLDRCEIKGCKRDARLWLGRHLHGICDHHWEQYAREDSRRRIEDVFGADMWLDMDSEAKGEVLCRRSS